MRILKAPALVVGFAAEARVARLSGWQVAIGGGTTAGAAHAVRRLTDAGATAIVSFGLAGGLDPRLPAGTLIVPEAVTADGIMWQTDPELNARLGGTTGHICLGMDRVVVSSAEKLHLSQSSGASLVDMESGAVAAGRGRGWRAIRGIAGHLRSRRIARCLRPRWSRWMRRDGFSGFRMAMSILTRPGQLAALFALARDAAAARRALRARALRMAPDPRGPGRMAPDGILPHGSLAHGSLTDGILDEELMPEGIL